MNTGSSVLLLTSSATCGRQNNAVANQSPSTVVDSSPSAAGALHPISQLLGASDDEHEPQSRTGHEAGRAGPDFYRNFYRARGTPVEAAIAVQQADSRSRSSGAISSIDDHR